VKITTADREFPLKVYESPPRLAKSPRALKIVDLAEEKCPTAGFYAAD
jgi:hypothetical protein